MYSDLIYVYISIWSFLTKKNVDWIKAIITEFGNIALTSTPQHTPPFAFVGQSAEGTPLPRDHWNKTQATRVPGENQTAFWEIGRKSEEENLGRRRNQESYFLTFCLFSAQLRRFLSLTFPQDNSIFLLI